MKDDIDIEKTLRRYRSDPGDRVKRSVMSRFANTLGNRRAETDKAGLWKKPVPLYLYAATLLLAVGLSFFAGQMMTFAGNRLDETTEPAPPAITAEVQEIRWEAAPNDVL